MPDTDRRYDLADERCICESLPYGLSELFEHRLTKGDLETLIGSKLVSFNQARKFAIALRQSADSGGVVLFPGSLDAFRSAVEFLGGSDERCCAELVAGEGLKKPLPFRFFALDNDTSLHLLFVARGSRADCNDLGECLYQTLGVIDVGAPGLTAINYFAVNLIKRRERMNSLICIDMVRLMLDTIPRWAEADHPADSN